MRSAAFASLAALSALSGFSQVISETPVFEIADVHPSVSATNPFTFASGGVLRGERYDLRKATMLDIIRMAYRVPPETIAGGPEWLEFDRFDIAAKAPADTSPETVRRMLQSLLLERFRLVVHNEVRSMPAYVLSGAGEKAKLTPSSGVGEAGCRYSQQPAGSTFNVWLCRNVTMAGFATQLRQMGAEYLKEPVVDGTGMEGAWDFDIRWTRRSAVLAVGAERTTIFDAVSKQLGLKLSLSNAPAPVLAIDRVEKPTPNASGVEQKLPPRHLEFDVADLKLNKSGTHGGFEYTRAGLRGTGVWLVPTLGFAWDMNTVHTMQRFAGLPKGVESVYIDIDARADVHTNGPAVEYLSGFDDDLRAMLRALLVERFRIKWHYEDRPLEAYTLVSAKPKLKKAGQGGRASCHEARTLANDPRDTNPLLSQLISCRNVSMAQFASKLQQMDDYRFVFPVEDATGIEGAWDFDLNFTPGEAFERSSGRSGGADALEPNGAVSLAEAITRQLGLRLEKRKRLLPAIVIDHMELAPLEN